MRKTIALFIALALTMFAVPSYSVLPQNLPHHNRSDVADWVKVFVPVQTNTFSGALVGVDSGGPVMEEVSSFGIAAVRIDTITDQVDIFYPLPDNICVSCPINVSVLWSTNDSAPATDTGTWTVTYGAQATGEALAAAATALDTVITADTISGTTYGLEETAQGVIAADTLSRGDMLHFNIKLSAQSGLDCTSDEVYLHGLYFEYVREKL